jgi:hypothetical protein
MSIAFVRMAVRTSLLCVSQITFILFDCLAHLRAVLISVKVLPKVITILAYVTLHLPHARYVLHISSCMCVSERMC